MDDMKSMMQNLLKAYDEAIGYYDFVINDISSEIYDPILQKNKGDTLAFLKAMRSAWKKSKEETEAAISNL